MDSLLIWRRFCSCFAQHQLLQWQPTRRPSENAIVFTRSTASHGRHSSPSHQCLVRRRRPRAIPKGLAAAVLSFLSKQSASRGFHINMTKTQALWCALPPSSDAYVGNLQCALIRERSIEILGPPTREHAARSHSISKRTAQMEIFWDSLPT